MVDLTVMLGSGVYVLRRGARVVYIGKCKNLLSRIYAHRRARSHRLPRAIEAIAPGVVFDSIEAHPCATDRLDEVFDLVCAQHNFSVAA